MENTMISSQLHYPPFFVVMEIACHVIKSTCLFHIEALQNGHHFIENIFKSIFLKEYMYISMEMSLRSKWR